MSKIKKVGTLNIVFTTGKSKKSNEVSSNGDFFCAFKNLH